MKEEDVDPVCGCTIASPVNRAMDKPYTDTASGSTTGHDRCGRPAVEKVSEVGHSAHTWCCEEHVKAYRKNWKIKTIKTIKVPQEDVDEAIASILRAVQ